MRPLRLLLVLSLPASSVGVPLFRKPKPKNPGEFLRTTADALITEAASLIDKKKPVNWLEELFTIPQNATNLERKDWGNALALALENFRIPAALVASSALLGAFELQPLATDSVQHAVMKRLHLLFSVASFTSSIVTVALATSALVQLNQRHSGHDTAAASIDDFMGRAGYPLEVWVAVNAHFTVGIASLCTAVALRCWVAVADRTFGQIATLLVGSGLMLAISLGLPHGSQDILLWLPVRYWKMVFSRAFDLRRPAPALISSLFMTLAAVGLAAREVVRLVVEGGGAAALA